MVAIATVIPGASYASGTFSIPWTALNAILSNDVTAVDNFEKLLYALLQCVNEKQILGSVTQPTLACEVANKAVQTGQWEYPANTFSDVTLVNFLAAFNFSTSLLENGTNIATS